MHTIREIVWNGGKLTFRRDSLLIWVGEVVLLMVCYINSGVQGEWLLVVVDFVVAF
jgi:hypothetical protein